MIKLLALDIDGTLIREDNKISAVVKESILKACNNGVKVVLLSGRNYFGMKEYIRELGLKGIAASANGAEIVSIEEESVIHQETIPYDIAKSVVEKSVSVGTVPINFSNLRVYTKGFDSLPRDYIKALNQEFHYIEDIYENLKNYPSAKLMLVGAREKLALIKDFSQTSYGDCINADYSMETLLEVYSNKADKGKALKYIMEHYQILKEETMCIGDSENDIPMFKSAGISVAMGNASENVKLNAMEITDHVENDGVKLALEKHVFERI
jgi:hypothetical protein